MSPLFQKLGPIFYLAETVKLGTCHFILLCGIGLHEVVENRLPQYNSTEEYAEFDGSSHGSQRI